MRRGAGEKPPRPGLQSNIRRSDHERVIQSRHRPRERGENHSRSVTGPVTLGPTDNSLPVASKGSISSSRANVDGVDGGDGTTWSIVNQGKVSSRGGWGVDLAGAQGSIGTITVGLGRGVVQNSGVMGGSILQSGGSATNNRGGSVAGVGMGFDFGAGVDTVTNNGSISAGVGVSFQYINQLDRRRRPEQRQRHQHRRDQCHLFQPHVVEGRRRNQLGQRHKRAGATIAGGWYGIQTGWGGLFGCQPWTPSTGGAVTITNAGTISGGIDSIQFNVGSKGSRLVVDPGAVFNGAEDAGTRVRNQHDRGHRQRQILRVQHARRG